MRDKIKDQNMDVKDRLDYTIAVISEFASAHGISTPQAYVYLDRYKGLDFIDEFYDVEHTLSFDDTVSDLNSYCSRQGGHLK